MREQLLVALHPFTLQGIDRSFHIDGIPQRDSCRHQRQSPGAVALIFRITIPDFTQTVQEYRSRQRVTGFSFIQSRLDPPTKCLIAEPVEQKQRSFNTVNFPKRICQTILFRLAGQFFHHQRCCTVPCFIELARCSTSLL